MMVEARPVTRYFVTLDALRGLCALFVAGGHLRTSGHLSQLPMLHGIGRWVDFFFVLSGFVIAHSAFAMLAEQPHRTPGFIVRRVGRIWPLHAVMLILLVGYQCALLVANRHGFVHEPVAFTDRYAPALLPANFGMVQVWLGLPYPSWNIPAWSISAEFAAYLVFALALWMMRARGRWFFLLLAVGSGALAVIWTPHVMGNDSNFAVLRCLFGFSTGVVAHWLWSHRPDWRLPLPGFAEPLMLVIAFGVVSLMPRTCATLFVPIFALTVLVFAQEQGWLSRAMGGTGGRLLGRYSYAIYIIHFLIATLILSFAAVAPKLGISAVTTGHIGTVTAIVGPPFLMDLLLIGYLALIVALAAISFRVIENPARITAARWAKRIDQRLAPAR